MKKFLTTLLMFFAFSGIFYCLSLFAWEALLPKAFRPNVFYPIGDYGHMYSRTGEVKDFKNVDILFLGSSHAYRGFDTRIFAKNGLYTFNLGSSAQTPIQTRLLLTRYLDDLNPKMVVYEVYPETFMSDGIESSLDVIANDHNDRHSLKMTFQLNNIVTYNTYLYALIHEAFGQKESFVETAKKGDDLYISGGFVQKKLTFFNPDPFRAKKIVLKEDQLESFKAIVSTLKKRNIELILVYAPIPKASYQLYSNPEYFDRIMTTYSEYYNFNKIVSLTDSVHFYDSNHLNQRGVDVFNNRFVEILRDRQNNLTLDAPKK